MTHEELTKIAMEASIAAAHRYQAMSGGMTVHEHAIETYISAKIAETLYAATKESGGQASLETTFREVEEKSEADRRGRPKASLPPSSRFDVVYSVAGRPVGLIEVKKRFSASRLEGDVIRLSEAVRKYGSEFGGSVQFGLAISLQRRFENGRDDPTVIMEKFRDSFDWAIPPVFASIDTEGDFNVSKRGRKVTGLRAYSVLFVSK